MFGGWPLVSAGWLLFSGGSMFLSLLRRVALACCLPLAAHAANSLVSLQTTVLTPAAAAEATRPFSGKTFSLGGKTFPVGTSLRGQKLPGLDPALTPVVAAEQDGSLFLIAQPANGPAV